ncbi:MAG: M20/M25/M40 family metallo-hydrolase [Candidatus Marinimicrobia bacterium]|nr:M20/M25/M40 family metallo-hydrolase [Candidatus Neomarinimicrobiota bacterium]
MVKKILILFLPIFLLANDGFIHHEINANVSPEDNFIEVIDRITLPENYSTKDLKFLLVKDLKVEVIGNEAETKLIEENLKVEDTGMDREELNSDFSVNKYKINPKNNRTFTLKYYGKINYPIEQMGEEYARSFSQTPGIICDKGVVLGGSTYWVPYFDEYPVTFNLKTTVPESWNVVSQGTRTEHLLWDGKKQITWEADKPMEEVYLIAAQFTEYHKRAGNVDVMAFLRTPDENLANKYLETTAQYLIMYENLIGKYPFTKFALIENFWETGYGMASFTLLGPQVIRFPFILHSSYPHELLHNWWGNSAYVDFDSGNWCEGLTVYMADHLIAEQRGAADDYRRSTLQKFTDYVNPETDFPLIKFLSRYDAASEAIGYGKSMMMNNMLRNEVGDELFKKGYQKFYQDNKYKFASFDDIRVAFETVSNKDLKAFFKQWTERKSAPELALKNVKSDDGRIAFNLEQIQPEDPFVLKVPVFFIFDNNVEKKWVEMTGRNQAYSFDFPSQPTQILVDPQYEVFRRLHHNEIPPALSKLFGSEKILLILPSNPSDDQKAIYRQLAEIWSHDKTKNLIIKNDTEIDNLDQNRAIWILGKDNKFASLVNNKIQDFDSAINDDQIKLGKTTYDWGNKSFVISARHPENPKNVISFLHINNNNAIMGLTRKLPHYGKYSYLVFEGDEPTNIGKGQWTAVNSPMNAIFDKESISVELPMRDALGYLAPLFNGDRMMETIQYLASDELQGRGLGSDGIEKAANFIADKFNSVGLQPGADDGTYFQKWNDVVDAEGAQGEVKNIIGIIPGTHEKYKDESVIVCAHYDHLGFGWPDVSKGNEGQIHPGADDNASGVAIMLELAEILNGSIKPQRTIIFVAFTSEENGLKGSQYYIDNYKKYPAKKVIGVLNLDTVGRLDNKKLMVLGSSSAGEWKFMFMGAGYVTGLESEMVTQDLDASDQSSFIKIGVPGVQFFTGPHQDYHKPSDTIDKIDKDGLVKVATFVKEAIVYLGDREEPMIFTGNVQPAHRDTEPKTSRSASAGFMPDFTHQGKGVRIGAISNDSPTAEAGLQKGDVILKIGGKEVIDLHDYSSQLKTCLPGDEVEFVYSREEKVFTTKIKLKAK